MNKYRVILFAAVCVAILLTSCSDNVVPPVSEQPASVTMSADPSEPPANLADELSGLWVRIDGSTATIPLTNALHDLFGGVGRQDAQLSTAIAYYSLLKGPSDLIFATYPSEKILTEARDLGIELEFIPIFKDALVFLANTENPVDGVSAQQLREIYTAKITNWKTLVGLDENIVPYQRTQSSASQTLLTNLVMDGLTPMQPPSEWVHSMGSLVEMVSSYDNARESIGYSMFYYVNNMYGSSQYKLLSVDGVKPSQETIMRGEYSLADYYYAVVRKDMPADSAARQLIAWLRTDDGQTLVAHAGYIPLWPLANDFPAETLDPGYPGDVDHSSGTGGTEFKPSTIIDDFVVNGVSKPLSDLFYDGFNYIQYINSEITSWLNSPMSSSLYSPGPISHDPPAAENAKRAFTGIPNDYPSYALVEEGNNNRYLHIDLPENNPFFNRRATLSIRLTSEISPYGTVMDDFSIIYDYDRRMLSNVDLFTLTVNLPQSSKVTERINSQLIAWTDGFPSDDGKAELLDMFVKWYADGYYLDHPEFAYRLQPSYGRWGDYLSVSYPLQTYDGPSTNKPTLYSICFDMNTGETINLAEHLPGDIPYSKGMVFAPITNFEAGTYPSEGYYQNYVPTDGSVITSAWLWGNGLGLYVTEPDGRKLQVSIYDWE